LKPTGTQQRFAIVAPSNLITLLDAIPPYLGRPDSKQMYTRWRILDSAGKALIISESPLTQAKSIVTPLLVGQGKNDPRVNVAKRSNRRRRARQRQAREYMVAADEGQGVCTAHQQFGDGCRDGRVLAQYLGGRYQQDLRDVAAKLKDITGDPRPGQRRGN